MLLPTTLVGSYPQPEWLIDRAKLAGRVPPRVRAKELWRAPEPYLTDALNDATLIAIPAPEDARLDNVTDGKVCRERRLRAGRRALHAGAPGEGAAVRAEGAQPRARGDYRNHNRPHLLRLCSDHPRAALGLLVPAGAGRLPLQSDLDRDGAVEPRLLGPRETVGQADSARHDRSLGHEG